MARIRASRVGEQIKKELSQIIQQELKDPRIGFVTVTAVEMSGDLAQAKVYVGIMGDKEQQESTLEGLEKARGFIRSEVGSRVPLRYTPELIFKLDQSLEHGQHISKLLEEVKRNDGKN